MRGCNGPVVEEGLTPGRAARRQIVRSKERGGWRFRTPAGRTVCSLPGRAAIRSVQSCRGARATGHLDGAVVEALWTAGGPFRPCRRSRRLRRPGPSRPAAFAGEFACRHFILGAC